MKRHRIRDSIGDSARPSANGISSRSRITSRRPACSSQPPRARSRVHVPTARAPHPASRDRRSAAPSRTTSHAVRAGGVHQTPRAEHRVVGTEVRTVDLQAAQPPVVQFGRTEEVQWLAATSAGARDRSPRAGPRWCGRRRGPRRSHSEAARISVGASSGSSAVHVDPAHGVRRHCPRRSRARTSACGRVVQRLVTGEDAALRGDGPVRAKAACGPTLRRAARSGGMTRELWTPPLPGDIPSIMDA